MTRTLLIATRNRGKLLEFERIFGALGVQVIGAADLGLPEVDEDADTFEGNATKKARACAAASGLLALADDSGLVVDALDGAPGVHSARYAGSAGDAANVDKLLDALAGVPEGARSARFRCVLALASPDDDEVALTVGTCEGAIGFERVGGLGFGYDPVFVPAGHTRTMAELGADEKDALSHRGQATQAMKAHLADRLRPR